MVILASSATRVSAHTAKSVNRRIEREASARLRSIGNDQDAIRQRLTELDREWDIERMLEANAATLAFTGTVLGLTVDKRFFALPLAVTAFLLQHAIQGWCPPLPVLRRLGFRTSREIEDE